MPNRAKPSFPQLNRSHPLAQGLVLDAIFSEGSGTSIHDTFGNIIGIPTGTTWVKTPYGYGLQFTPTTDVIRFPHYGPIDTNTRISIETVFLIRAFTTTSGGRISGPNGQWSFNLVNNGINPTNSMQFFANWSTGGGAWYSGANTFSTNIYYHFIGTYDASSTSNAPLFYLNGARLAATLDTSPTGTFPASSAQDFYVGNNNSNIRGFDGIIAYTRYWNRILSQQEAAQLAADPFQIYKKKSFSL